MKQRQWKDKLLGCLYLLVLTDSVFTITHTISPSDSLTTYALSPVTHALYAVWSIAFLCIL